MDGDPLGLRHKLNTRKIATLQKTYALNAEMMNSIVRALVQVHFVGVDVNCVEDILTAFPVFLRVECCEGEYSEICQSS